MKWQHDEPLQRQRKIKTEKKQCCQLPLEQSEEDGGGVVTGLGAGQGRCEGGDATTLHEDH